MKIQYVVYDRVNQEVIVVTSCIMTVLGMRKQSDWYEKWTKWAEITPNSYRVGDIYQGISAYEEDRLDCILAREGA